MHSGSFSLVCTGGQRACDIRDAHARPLTRVSPCCCSSCTAAPSRWRTVARWSCSSCSSPTSAVSCSAHRFAPCHADMLSAHSTSPSQISSLIGNIRNIYGCRSAIGPGQTCSCRRGVAASTRDRTQKPLLPLTFEGKHKLKSSPRAGKAYMSAGTSRCEAEGLVPRRQRHGRRPGEVADLADEVRSRGLNSK